MKSTYSFLMLVFLVVLGCNKDKAAKTAVTSHTITFSGIGSGYKSIISLQPKGTDSLTVLSSVDNIGQNNNFTTTIHDGDHIKIEFIPDNPTQPYLYKLSDNNKQVAEDYINLATGTTVTITYPKVTD